MYVYIYIYMLCMYVYIYMLCMYIWVNKDHHVHPACKVWCPSAMAFTVMAVISACSCWKAKFSTLNLKAQGAALLTLAKLETIGNHGNMLV